MARPATPDERAERRHQVAQLMLCKVTQAQMAGTVGVSRKTVNEDVAAIRAEWKRERVEAYDQYLAEDIALLAELQAAIMPAAMAGKWPATDRVLAIVAQRSRLLGTDAPVKSQHEVTVHDGDSDLDREIAELLESLASLGQGEAPVEAPGPGEPAHP